MIIRTHRSPQLIPRSVLACTAAGALLASNPAAALDRRVQIINESRHDIVALYGVNVDARDWRESLLGEDRLPAGASVVLNFEDGSGYCRYKFRALFDDGVELIRPSVNVCEVGTYRYTD